MSNVKVGVIFKSYEPLAAIQRCYEEYGFYGVKFNGAQDDYVIDDPAIMPFIEKAAGYGKPIAFHVGADFYETTHPYRLGRIAARLTETQFHGAHGRRWYPAVGSIGRGDGGGASQYHPHRQRR